MLHTNNPESKGLKTTRRRIAVAVIAAVRLTVAMAVVPVLVATLGTTTSVFQDAYAQSSNDLKSTVQQAREALDDVQSLIPPTPQNAVTTFSPGATVPVTFGTFR